MIYYKVKDQIFWNCFSAFVYAAYNDAHQEPRFCVYDKDFQKYDWTKEPTQSWESLLTQRAQQLREKYDVLILGFSGGTDSITIYNTFVKNNIFIDEISFVWDENHPAGTEYIGKWLEKHHPDSHTRITHAKMSERQFDEFYQNSSWLLESLDNMQIKVERRWPNREILREAEDRYSGKKWAFVVGKEKPQIYKRHGKWFATHLDKITHWSTTHHHYDRTELFYISPDAVDLHVKQCHMLKRYSEIAHRPTDGWSSWKKLGKHSAQSYDEFAYLGCGRDTEILQGSSFAQKIRAGIRTIDDATHLLDGQIEKIPGIEPLFLEKYLSGHTWARNYIQGLQSLQTDSTLIDYLRRHSLLSSPTQPVINYNGMFSQSYALE